MRGTESNHLEDGVEAQGSRLIHSRMKSHQVKRRRSPNTLTGGDPHLDLWVCVCSLECLRPGTNERGRRLALSSATRSFCGTRTLCGGAVAAAGGRQPTTGWEVTNLFTSSHHVSLLFPLHYISSRHYSLLVLKLNLNIVSQCILYQNAFLNTIFQHQFNMQVSQVLSRCLSA